MEIGELVAQLNATDAEKSHLCPFCHEKPHGHGELSKKEPSLEVESHPSRLGCTKVRRDAAPRYTTASHHLIPAIQSYACVRRLVRMGNAVGYDINNPDNGAPLPTYRNPYDGEKFGDIKDDGRKQQIAEEVMQLTKKQWHVSDHQFAQGSRETWVDKSPDESGPSNVEISHVVSYDTSVIRLLLKVCQKPMEKPLCEMPNTSGDFVAKMKEISDEIRSHLDKFGADVPWESRPFFVSKRAQVYAEKQQGGRVW